MHRDNEIQCQIVTRDALEVARDYLDRATKALVKAASATLDPQEVRAICAVTVEALDVGATVRRLAAESKAAAQHLTEGGTP